MAKVAVFLPNQQMREIAVHLLPEYPRLEIIAVEVANSAAPLAECAQKLTKEGCDLFIARGLQARVLRSAVEQPVIDIQVESQELGMIITEAKNRLNIRRPRIGVVCSPNMLCSTSNFQELFDIDLYLYPAAEPQKQADAADQAIDDGMDIVIGGSMVCGRAQKRGVECAFLMSGEIGLRATFATAERVCYAIDLEQRRSARYLSMLDHTFNGILQIDESGKVVLANLLMEPVLALDTAKIVGRQIFSLIPQLDKNLVDNALIRDQETYANMLDIHNKTYALNIVPMRTEDDRPTALLVFQEGRRIQIMDRKLRRELAEQGYFPQHTFENLPVTSAKMQAVTEQAKQYARHNAPILICSPEGCEAKILADCIHNFSLRRRNSYILHDCQPWSPGRNDAMLFGVPSDNHVDSCLSVLAQDGTLVLKNIEYLSLETQYKIMELIDGWLFLNSTARMEVANIRLIATTSADLAPLVVEGRFRSDLYYAIRIMSLEVPALRTRRDDILGWTEFFMDRWRSKHDRDVRLAAAAAQVIREYDWPGNLYQLERFCERVVLLSPKHKAGEVFIRRLLEESYPVISREQDQVIVYKDKKAMEITELLNRHRGNQEKVAQELGVSKTTLWRYMKKYGIEASEYK